MENEATCYQPDHRKEQLMAKALKCVLTIQNVLWPNDSLDSEWDSETLDLVRDALLDEGFAPRELLADLDMAVAKEA